MDYLEKLKYHYKPSKGWINDPNGLVYFKGYYHIFYQHSPDYEAPGPQAMHWGHARTKDFLSWEELPIALFPDKEYDDCGCWSGTAIEKNQAVSVAYSDDGINFTKYDKNPVIAHYPPDGGPNFRDPAVCYINGQYYCVMATGNPQEKAGRLLLYRSDDLFNWEYDGIMCEWKDCEFTECPSFMSVENHLCLLTASVCPIEKERYFSVMYGQFSNNKFSIQHVAQLDKGPDQYAGQVFRDNLNRNILITWIPGWKYISFAEKDVGCMSIPREIKLVDGKIIGYPVKEVQHLLTDTDPSVKMTDTGFVIERQGRDPIVYVGEIRDLKILRDKYVVEVFVNGGEEIYSALL